MKVLHVFDHSVPYFSGYTFRSGYIVSNQRKLGFEPVVLTSLKHGKQDGLEEIIDGQTYYRTPHFENPVMRWAVNQPVAGESLHMMRLYHRIMEVHRKEQIDLIHAHSPALNGLPALRAARVLGIPMVYEIRAFWEDAGTNLGTYKGEQSFKYRAVRRLETHIARHADEVTTICEGLRGELQSRGVDPGKITIIPNGVEADRFLPIPRNQALMDELNLEPGKVMGFIGSFYDYEGLDVLIRGFAQVREVRDDLKLLLVGGGYQGQDEKLKALCRSLGVEESCLFTGRVPHDRVNDYYSIIDFFAYPRKSMRVTELVTPLKPLEAMSMEKVVLGSAVGGIAELVEDGVNGYLFEPDNPESLARTLLHLLEDPESLEQMGPRARQHVKEHRNWEKIVKRYIRVYGSAMEKCRVKGTNKWPSSGTTR